MDEIKALRHALGSIDITDFELDEDMPEGERKAYLAEIANVFSRLEKDIKRLTKEQILLTIEADDEKKLTYGRGTINGISLLYELWKSVAGEYQAGLKPKEDFQKNNPIAEV